LIATGRAQRGVSLVEALVALLVMSFGMVALVGILSSLRRAEDLARQRGEAQRIAQSEIARLRSFSVIDRPAAAAAGVVAFSDMGVGTTVTREETPPDSNVKYTVTQTSAWSATTPNLAEVRVSVTWNDRVGDAQVLALDTLIAAVDPVFGGGLAVPQPVGVTRQPANRSPDIPVGAKDLGDKTSAYKPSPGGGTAWVFDNQTGLITKSCSVSTGIATSAITSGDLTSCASVSNGLFVSGTIRFSMTAPPNARVPEATAAPAHAAVTLISTGHPAAPVCFDDSGTVPYAITYACLILGNTDTPSIWSGSIELTGIDTTTLPTPPYRVCRYTFDYNRNGTPDNEEHPATYANVAKSLPRQNFLVIAGAQSCPVDSSTFDPAARNFVNYTTKEQQPTRTP
jgi:Tfp pilus assembly protein PilV